ncbi:hypothetical protein ACTL32_11375 [Planococcus sp. FY231025]|uniref:hypothetical protein n=1 Tax=Planococcus sp. FY231025 TaxID=3455699 RepID=UPI003F92612C
MDQKIKMLFEDSRSTDKERMYSSYLAILEATEQPVDWAYEVWDGLVAGLGHKDNHQRSRAVQYLANLAKSDPDKRMLEDFPRIWVVTKDEKFVTARHAVQSMWKIALAGPEQNELVTIHLSDRFRNCEEEKNGTLIRSDIQQNFRNIYDVQQDENLRQTALQLIDSVDDPKYKKKYKAIWK